MTLTTWELRSGWHGEGGKVCLVDKTVARFGRLDMAVSTEGKTWRGRTFENRWTRTTELCY
jgi:hypothetical protein